MEYQKLGRTGLKVSRLCLGTMNFGWPTDEPAAFAIMDAAVEAGINFFDTADMYSNWVAGFQGGESETIIGKWLRTRARRDLVIATKVRDRLWDGPNGEGLSRAHILQAVEDSLRRLQTDYIDLYQVHWPDDETPLDETLAALDQLIRDGKVRYVGASNYPAWLLVKALWISDLKGLARFDCLQPRYNLLYRSSFESELEPACLDQNVGVIPFSPLAEGFLSGKYTREQPYADTSRADSGLVKRLAADPDAFAVLDEARRIASAQQISIAQVALAWLLARPSITAPIVGPRTVEQLREVVSAATVILLAEDVEALNTASKKF
jgi:aryl-alcohol dehydrogenase-like predicted oxidoreductase